MSRSIPLGRDQVDRLPALRAELIRQQVAVIVPSGGTAPAFAAKAATSTIPIVFVIPDDPVSSALCQPLPSGRQCDGNQFFPRRSGPKRLELLRELVPAMSAWPFSSIRPMLRGRRPW